MVIPSHVFALVIVINSQLFALSDLFPVGNLTCVVKNSFCCLVEEWFYFVNIGGIIDDLLLEENRAIIIYLRNGEWAHEF